MLVIAKLCNCSPTVLKTPALNQTYLEEDSPTNVVFPSTNCGMDYNTLSNGLKSEL